MMRADVAARNDVSKELCDRLLLLAKQRGHGDLSDFLKELRCWREEEGDGANVYEYLRMLINGVTVRNVLYIPTMETLTRIAQKLNVSVGQLLSKEKQGLLVKRKRPKANVIKVGRPKKESVTQEFNICVESFNQYFVCGAWS